MTAAAADTRPPQLFGVAADDEGRVSEEELRLIVMGAQQSGGIEQEEAKMVEGVLDLQVPSGGRDAGVVAKAWFGAWRCEGRLGRRFYLGGGAAPQPPGLHHYCRLAPLPLGISWRRRHRTCACPR